MYLYKMANKTQKRGRTITGANRASKYSENERNYTRKGWS